MTCFVYPNSLSYQTYNVILFSFFPIKVEFESKIEHPLVPIISDDTNSVFVEYLI